MLWWVDEILKPYLKCNPPPPGIMPIILLDAYQCHMMASVTNTIAELGIKIIHIPGGCTGLTQPLDVGINKPFKSRVRASWEEWMINEINCTGLVYAPTREDISSWMAEVVWRMDGKNLMQNAWKKTGYDWFFEEGAVNVGDDDDVDDVINDDDDASGDTDFDEVDVANMLEYILGCGRDSDDESNDDEMLGGEA